MSERTRRWRAGVAGVVLTMWPVLAAAAPTGWLGDGTSRFPAADPPLTWSPTRNVVWSTELPSWGNASPILSGGTVFVTSEPATLVAVDAATGRVKWQRTVSVVDALEGAEATRARDVLAKADETAALLAERQKEFDRLKRDARKKGGGAEAKARLETLGAELETLKKSYDTGAEFRTPADIPTVGTASSTPVTDGKGVFAVFGNGVVARFALDGKLVWTKWMGIPTEQMHGYFRGQSASPLLVGGKLVVGLRQLRALDPETGRELWTAGEYKDFGTPAAAKAGGTDVVVTPSGEVVRVSDGVVLARGLGSIFYVGPLVDGDRVYFVGSASDVELSEQGHAHARAVQLGKVSGNTLATKTVWDVQLDRERYYGSPLVAGGRLFLLNRYDGLTVLDTVTGKRLEQRTLPFRPGQVYPSLVLAGRHVFATKETGETVVFEAAPKFAQVAANELEELRATPVFDGKRMYVRGLTRLWCLEERPGR